MTNRVGSHDLGGVGNVINPRSHKWNMKMRWHSPSRKSSQAWGPADKYSGWPIGGSWVNGSRDPTKDEALGLELMSGGASPLIPYRFDKLAAFSGLPSEQKERAERKWCFDLFAFCLTAIGCKGELWVCKFNWCDALSFLLFN